MPWRRQLKAEGERQGLGAGSWGLNGRVACGRGRRGRSGRGKGRSEHNALVGRDEVFDVDERVLSAVLLEHFQRLLDQIAQIQPAEEEEGGTGVFSWDRPRLRVRRARCHRPPLAEHPRRSDARCPHTRRGGRGSAARWLADAPILLSVVDGVAHVGVFADEYVEDGQDLPVVGNQSLPDQRRPALLHNARNEPTRAHGG